MRILCRSLLVIFASIGGCYHNIETSAFADIAPRLSQSTLQKSCDAPFDIQETDDTFDGFIVVDGVIKSTSFDGTSLPPGDVSGSIVSGGQLAVKVLKNDNVVIFEENVAISSGVMLRDGNDRDASGIRLAIKNNSHLTYVFFSKASNESAVYVVLDGQRLKLKCFQVPA